jgi:diguanylate cyclase (GGDEF)-like protein
MRDVAAPLGMINVPTSLDSFGADFSALALPLTELRPDLRPLLQRIACLEQRNQELETMARHLEISVRELSDLVYVDALTGLANRRGFDAALESELRRAARNRQPLALLLCDLDRFKHCNDTYGHGYGDVVLARIATLLKSFCNREGDCAARYGGEEFALLLPGVVRREAVLIADRLRRSVADLAAGDGHSRKSARVTISVGATSGCGSAALQPRQLVDAADAALYRAKRGGRNRVKYEEVVGDTGIEPVASPV